MSENVNTVRRIYEAFARGDAAVLLAALDDKVEWHEAEHITYWPGGAFIGPQAVLERVIARIPNASAQRKKPSLEVADSLTRTRKINDR